MCDDFSWDIDCDNMGVLPQQLTPQKGTWKELQGLAVFLAILSSNILEKTIMSLLGGRSEYVLCVFVANIWLKPI